MFKLDEVRQQFNGEHDFDLDCIFMSKDYELTKVLIEKDLKKEIIKNFIDKFIFITKDKKVVEYDPVVKLDDCIDSIGVEEINTLNGFKNKFDDITVIDQINNFEDIENSRAYIIILNNKDNDSKIIFFKKFFGSIYLKSKLKILYSEGRFKKINDEILSIDDKFDCVMYEDDMAVFTQIYFEQIFDYRDEYTKKANETILKIKDLHIIKNIEDIEADSDKMTIKKKLARVKNEDIIWFKEKINNDFESIQEIISIADLDMEIKDGEIISNDTSELIHLIQDDYLKSNLSGENYVSDKKKKIILR